jgi:DNA-binding transcriptional ArsR family regulator
MPGRTHSCYLRTRLIAAETDLSEAGVRKALTRLLDAGLVRVYDRYDRTGKRISNRYQVWSMALRPPPRMRRTTPT